MVHKMKTLEVLYDYTRGEDSGGGQQGPEGTGVQAHPGPHRVSSPPGSCWRPGRETPDEANGWGILDHGGQPGKGPW